jgi:hypothetical protein
MVITVRFRRKAVFSRSRLRRKHYGTDHTSQPQVQEALCRARREQFKDIKIYKRVHGQELKRVSRAKTAAKKAVRK